MLPKTGTEMPDDGNGLVSIGIAVWRDPLRFAQGRGSSHQSSPHRQPKAKNSSQQF